MIAKQPDFRHSWIRRTIVAPVLRSLRYGASPQQIAWSLAAGFVIGINPVPGSTTFLTLAVTHLFRLNHAASQVGTHSAYPLQLALLLPFLHAGTVVFGSPPVPFAPKTLVTLMRQHPLQTLRSVWMWEWHALVVWAVIAVALMPACAVLMTRVLQRAARRASRSTMQDDAVNVAT